MNDYRLALQHKDLKSCKIANREYIDYLGINRLDSYRTNADILYAYNKYNLKRKYKVVKIKSEIN